MNKLDELIAKDRNKLKVSIGINVTLQQIAELGPERARAFMLGLGKVIAAANQLGKKPA